VEPVRPHAPQRFWTAAAVSTGLGFLAGWFLMPPLAPLLYVMGLFFFLLIGLLLGAAAYRFAQPAAPIPKNRLWGLIVVVSLTLWSATMVKEYLHLPLAAEDAVRKSFKMIPNADERQRLETGLRQFIVEHFKTQYAPGSLIGYARWSLFSGELEVPRILDGRTVHLKMSQRKFWWGFRVIFSLLFTAGAFASQVLPLGPPKPAPPELSETPAS
jgi:hypothetical protein